MRVKDLSHSECGEEAQVGSQIGVAPTKSSRAGQQGKAKKQLPQRATTTKQVAENSPALGHVNGFSPV